MARKSAPKRVIIIRSPSPAIHTVDFRALGLTAWDHDPSTGSYTATSADGRTQLRIERDPQARFSPDNAFTGFVNLE